MPIGEGQKLQPDEFLTITVVARPTTAARASGVYIITGDDGQGAQQVAITMNSTPPAGAVTTSGKCLDIRSAGTANGAAASCTPVTGLRPGG